MVNAAYMADAMYPCVNACMGVIGTLANYATVHVEVEVRSLGLMPVIYTPLDSMVPVFSCVVMQCCPRLSSLPFR